MAYKFSIFLSIKNRAERSYKLSIAELQEIVTKCIVYTAVLTNRTYIITDHSNVLVHLFCAGKHGYFCWRPWKVNTHFFPHVIREETWTEQLSRWYRFVTGEGVRIHWKKNGSVFYNLDTCCRNRSECQRCSFWHSNKLSSYVAFDIINSPVIVHAKLYADCTS
jgi:hypothetical protein